jgi:4-carboxymuconolactone decarboxylase
VTEQRVAPLPPQQWDDEVMEAIHAGVPDPAVVARYLSDGPDALRVPNVLSTLVNNPALAGPFFRFNDVMLRHGTIDARLRELMILRVASRTRSAYEWAQHARLAKRFDITPEEVAAVGAGRELPSLSPLEKLLIAATDELLDNYNLSDETWASLSEHLDVPQLVEVLFVVGTYTSLAMVFNSAGLQLDPELRDRAELQMPTEE